MCILKIGFYLRYSHAASKPVISINSCLFPRHNSVSCNSAKLDLFLSQPVQTENGVLKTDDSV